MKPVKLSIEGVFSYRKKQVIDFRKLSAGGIFGIFGNTGSGKSSIIEALIFVLYGKLDRISGRRVDLINLRSDKAVIEFEFESFGKNYPAVANLKRTQDSHTSKSMMYVMEEGEYRSVGENVRVEDIIGLSYENFCKIVIIPQGRFQEFFSLTEAARTSMLKEIFPALREFDLTNAVKDLRERTKADLDVNTGKLNQLEEYTKEAFEEASGRFSQIKEAFEEAERQNNSRKQSLAEEKSLLQLFVEKEKNAQKKERLEQQLPQISAAEKELNDYEMATDKFKAALSVYDNCLIQKKDTETKSKENAFRLAKEREKNREARQAYEEILKKEEQTPLQREEIKQLEALMELQKVEAEKENLNLQLSQQKASEAKGRELSQDLEIKKQSLEAEIANMEAKLPDPARFAAVRNWFSEMDVLSKGEERIERELGELERQMAVLSDKLGIPQHEDFASSAEKRRMDLQQRSSVFENEHLKYLQEQAICRYSASLVDKEPCPLCGSLSHPRPADRGVADKHLAETEAEIHTSRERLESLNKVIYNHDSLSKQCNAKRAELQSKRGELELWKKQFVWAEYEDKTFDEVKALEKADAELRSRMDTKRKELDVLRQRSDMYAKRMGEIANAMNSIRNELAKCAGRTEQLLAGVNSDLKEKYSSFSPEELNGECKKRNAVLEKRNAERISRNAVLENSNAVLIRLDNEENHYGLQMSRQQQQKTDAEEVLKIALQESGFTDLEQVRRILNRSIDMQAVRNKINDFRSQKKMTDSRYAELSEQTADKIKPDEDKIRLDEQMLSQKEAELKAMLEEKGRMEGRVKLIEEKLREKHELQKGYDALLARFNGLEELFNMFKGEKFVKFISSVYIEQLCSKANERLRIISNGKFEIRYLDNGFFIADYLNEGKTRSIKTLSGGQMFQASLCMALALVDTIRLNSDTNQDFFFIDEGFGTQDTESLDLIYQSLKALRKEEKVVGLISHSDVLKEKITSNISIRMDEKEGSLIEYGGL